MNPHPITDREERGRQVREHQERHARRSDFMYIAGAVLVTAGVGLVHWKFAPIAAGAFCLFPPLLELASGFLKGLHSRPR